ncbi:MAG: divalent cation tolerance protein CutA [Methanothrix sp.]|nr:divalent cation tolerance protein CutA [Methanothrix sp.]
MSGKDEFLVVYCTAPPEEADTLARTLEEEHLAACVNTARQLLLHLGGKAELGPGSVFNNQDQQRML